MIVGASCRWTTPGCWENTNVFYWDVCPVALVGTYPVWQLWAYLLIWSD